MNSIFVGVAAVGAIALAFGAPIVMGLGASAYALGALGAASSLATAATAITGFAGGAVAGYALITAPLKTYFDSIERYKGSVIPAFRDCYSGQVETVKSWIRVLREEFNQSAAQSKPQKKSAPQQAPKPPKPPTP